MADNALVTMQPETLAMREDPLFLLPESKIKIMLFFAESLEN